MINIYEGFMLKIKIFLYRSLICFSFGLTAITGGSRVYGDGIGAKQPLTKEIARGGHGGGHHGGHHHGGHHHGHHGHGHHHGRHHHGHFHHHHNHWWHHPHAGWNRHWHGWNHWNYWHHPWHNAYWYGNGYWGSSPGYLYDPSFYYNLNGTPSIEYENDVNPYYISPFMNIENTNENVPFLPYYMNDEANPNEEGIFPLLMKGANGNRFPAQRHAPAAASQKNVRKPVQR